MHRLMVILGIAWLIIGISAGSAHPTMETIGLINSSVWCVGSLLSLEHD